MSLIPKYFESEWHRPGESLTSADPEWPRIGVFCVGQPIRPMGSKRSSVALERSHAASPWISGSFEVSSDLLEERELIHWGWSDDFATGDGYLIRLGRGSRAQGQERRGWTPLVDDAPQTRQHRDERLARMRTALEEGRADVAQHLSEQDDAEQARLRAKVSIECERCGERLELRAEKAQGALSRIWAAGVREISIQDLRRALRIASR